MQDIRNTKIIHSKKVRGPAFCGERLHSPLNKLKKNYLKEIESQLVAHIVKRGDQIDLGTTSLLKTHST